MVTLHKKTQTQVMCTERRHMIVGLTLWPHDFHPWCVAPLPSAPAGSPLSASSGPHLCPGADSVQNISINMVYFAADSVQIIHSINLVYTGADSVQNILLLFFTFCFFPTFYNCIVPMGFPPWEIWVAVPRESQLWQSHYPTYRACWVFLCLRNRPNSDMANMIF